MPIALWALAISAFAIGTTEFVIMGLLPEVAANLGTTLSSAGLLVTGYALGVFVGAPLVTATTGKLPRKTLLVSLMVLFVIGNIGCAIAPDYTTLMISRIVASFSHGAFFGVGSVVATGLVPKEKQASAIALMFTGLTVANVLGVPFGTWLGQMYGWRSTFWAVSAIGVVALLATAYLVPRSDDRQDADFRSELRVLGRPQVLLGLLMTVLGFGGVFAAFTYIAPILTDITGFQPGAVSPILLLFGVGLVGGNLLGGKFADKYLMPTLVISLVLLAGVLVLFSFTSHYKLAASRKAPTCGTIQCSMNGAEASTRSLPTGFWLRMRIDSSARSMAATISRACSRNTCPSSVRSMRRVVRVSRLVPSFSSSRVNARLTPDVVCSSTSAAALRLPASTTAIKIRISSDCMAIVDSNSNIF